MIDKILDIFWGVLGFIFIALFAWWIFTGEMNFGYVIFYGLLIAFFVIAISLGKKIARFVTRTVFSIKSDIRIQGWYRIIYGVIFVSVFIGVGLITFPYIDGFQLPKWALFQQEVEPFPIDLILALFISRFTTELLVIVLITKVKRINQLLDF